MMASKFTARVQSLAIDCIWVNRFAIDSVRLLACEGLLRVQCDAVDNLEWPFNLVL